MPSPEHHFDEEGDMVVHVPEFTITTPEGDLRFDWFNTLIRTFYDPQYDHVEYTDEGGEKYGIVVSEEVRTKLVINNFPVLYRPLPDEQTREWLVSTLVKKIPDNPVDIPE